MITPARASHSELERRPDSQVVTLTDAQRPQWDRYVRAHPDGTFCHLAGWRAVIEGTFGHPCQFLMLIRNGAVAGVLPLARVRSWLFGDALISLPFCVYGGVVADDEAAARELEQHACRIADRMGVDYLELRNRQPRNPDWPSKDLYVTFSKPVSTDHEANLAAVPRKQRAMIRKGIKAGLQIAFDPDLDRLYRCFAESVRNLGTPVFPRRYFRALLTEFGDDCEIAVASLDGEAVSAVMSFYFRDQVMPYYGGGTAAARAVKGSDYLYWEVMRRAVERGAGVFDYGRSKVDSGPYKFKKNWGFEPQPLCYEYYLVKATEMPNLSPTNPRYSLMISTWKRLPLWLASRLGPPIAKYLG